MAWLYVPESERWTSGSTSPPEEPTAPWVTLSGKPTQRQLSWRGWKTRPWIARLFGTISRPSMAERGVASWISSLAESRANPTASQGSGSDTKTTAPYGPRSPGSQANATRRSSSSKRCLASLTYASLFGPSFELWVSSGLRLCSRRPRSTDRRRTGSEFFSSLPALSAVRYGRNKGGSNPDGPERPSLETLVRGLPTLKSSDGDKGGPNQRGSGGDLTMNSVVARLPACTASDVAASGAAGYSTSSGRHSGTTMTDAVCGAASGPRNGYLNPLLCEWEQGLPIGWTGSEPLETSALLRWLTLTLSALSCADSLEPEQAND